jgi:hypothetical protein
MAILFPLRTLGMMAQLFGAVRPDLKKIHVRQSFISQDWDR